MVENKKILIVDDSEDQIMFISRILENSGYSYLVTRNGKDALLMMKSQKPDLIILDLMMPDNGIFVLEEMNKNPDLDKIPVIVCTGAAEATGINMKTGEKLPFFDQCGNEIGTYIYEALKKQKFDDFIEKPVNPALLIEKIKKLI